MPSITAAAVQFAPELGLPGIGELGVRLRLHGIHRYVVGWGRDLGRAECTGQKTEMVKRHDFRTRTWPQCAAWRVLARGARGADAKGDGIPGH